MGPTRIAVVLVLLTATAMAAACDDGNGDAAQRMTAEEYNLRFDVVQEEQEEIARRRLAALPSVEIRSSDGLDEAERDYLRQFADARLANANEMGRALSELSPPEELEDAHDAFLDALAERVRFLRGARERVETASTAAEMFAGQQDINRQVFTACAALNEAVVAAGAAPPLMNCSLEETPPQR